MSIKKITDRQELNKLKWLKGATRYNNGGTVHKNLISVRAIRRITGNLKTFD